MLHFQVVGLWRPYPPPGLAFSYSETRKELSWNLMRDVPDTKRCPAIQALHSDSFLSFLKNMLNFALQCLERLFTFIANRLQVIFNMAAAECCSFQMIPLNLPTLFWKVRKRTTKGPPNGSFPFRMFHIKWFEWTRLLCFLGVRWGVGWRDELS